MYLCESLLMTVIVMMGAYVTYTDIKNGIVQNKAIISAMIIGVLINSVYLGLYCRNLIILYLLNLGVMTLLSLALYGFHFWAAGDSKLLICMNLLFPARFYMADGFTIAPGINAIIFIFLLAYGYLIVDSLIQLIKKKKFYNGYGSNQINIKHFLGNLILGFIYMRALNELLRFIMGDYYIDNRLVFSFVSIFAVMLVYDKEIFKKLYIVIPIIIIDIVLIIRTPFQGIDIYSYMILILALLLRFLLNGFNYQEIETQNVKKGMVLSYPTVLLFTASKVKGLPEKTYEDMRSRLTQEQVEAIIRWEKSKNGKERIVIVRKIPFAIFIVLGEVTFFLVRLRGY